MSRIHYLQYMKDLENSMSSNNIIEILERIYQDINIGQSYTIQLQKIAIRCLKEMIIRF